MVINCLHPDIILNPLAKELISMYGNYTIRGQFVQLYKHRSFLYATKLKQLQPKSLGITPEDIDNCFITDTDTGVCYPLYMQVPCGHCDACKKSKVNAFVHRCKLETMLYDCQPIFLTLTYDDLHKKECGVCLRDVQLFFKRLRINLQRQGFRRPLRYVCVSEYGKRTKRSHYHAILWNLGQSDFLSYQQIGEIIKKSWSNGFEMHRLIDPRNDKAFYYTSKYLSKDCDVPDGCNPTFMVSSNRGGAIGAKFLDAIAYHVRKTYNIHARFVNKWNGKTEMIQWNRYSLSRIFPSLSRSIGSDVKTAVRTFLLNYKILETRNNVNYEIFDKKAIEVAHFFGQYFYCPILESSEIKTSMEVSTNQLLSEMLKAEIVIDKALSKGHDYYRRCFAISRDRDWFLTKLFADGEELTFDIVKSRSIRFRHDCALAADRELF